MPTSSPLSFYAEPGPMTDLEVHSGWLKEIPTSVPDLVEVVQGLVVHVFWAERYGLSLDSKRTDEVTLRSAAEMLSRARELNSSPVSFSRPLEQRLVGNCRDFSVLLAALLRHVGVPARVRCGFGLYFREGYPEDHWICEVWEPLRRAWLRVDPQLDDFQCDALNIDFDPLAVPYDRFLTGAEAWRQCRAGEADPDKFGIFDMRGLWFVRGNVVRDLAALNKVELLPWDCWGLIDEFDESEQAGHAALLDQVAALNPQHNHSFADVRRLYRHPLLRVQPVIRTRYGDEPAEEVTI